MRPSAPQAQSASGCGEALAYLILIGFIFAVVGGVALSSPTAALVLAILIAGCWIGIAQWSKRRRAAKAAAEYQRQLDEYQRHQAAQEAERLRQLQEHQHNLALQAAETERQRQARWEYLVARYGEPSAQKIWLGRPWVGCTEPMLQEMLGFPDDIDEKVLKTKTKYTYKYRHKGGNRYGLRVYLEGEEVTGWEDKD